MMIDSSQKENEGLCRLSERLTALVTDMLEPTAIGPGPIPVDRQLNELGMKSLGMVQLVLALEAEFDVFISQDKITQANFRSISSILELLTRILPPQATP